MGAPEPHVLVGVDCRELRLNPNAPRCDFIFFSNNLVAPLELKRGKVRASRIVRQLQAGADLAARIAPSKVSAHFIPVAAYGGKIHRAESIELNRSRIRFRRSRFSIELLKCGGPLSAAIRKAGVG